MLNKLPLDYPENERAYRIYVALTNHCNRACPWCSMYSSPEGKSYISEDNFRKLIPQNTTYQMQFEGGEPLTHPLFWNFLEISKNDQNCERIIICSNGTLIPRNTRKLTEFLDKIGRKFTLKISINHHLYEQDKKIFSFAKLLTELLPLNNPDRLLVLNVRLRQNNIFDQKIILSKLNHYNLLPWANVFYLQKYGLAKNQQDWGEPFAVGENFALINPDGKNYGSNLLTRSEAMKDLA